MTLHLLKLCVGIDDIEALRRAQRGRTRRVGGVDTVEGRTRMMPRRRAEILAGGSLYWVIRGTMRARQRVLGLEAATEIATEEGEGRPFCRMILDAAVIPVEPRPRRPFQGWRYLDPEEAPPDIAGAAGAEDAPMPPALLAELRALGLV